ncbi:hypothetical protein N0V90_002902 [Kalmusia sp. IMI 367209]|nr:hypothetical protein N0V90_002902 [Kalmusia sp. IMI 367209]
MPHYLVRKGGIPALAYSTPNAASPLSCLLAVVHSEAYTQATISLRFSIHIVGFDDEQSFTLLYDANNLIPGSGSLGPAIVQSQAHHDEIARQGIPDVKTLSLALKRTCPIHCPPSASSIAPRHGSHPSFRQLADLARATEVHILFDYSWLHRKHHARFQRIIEHPERFTGIWEGHYDAKSYRKADWTIFSPVEDAVFEDPPSYADVAKKRHRRARNNSTPEPPSPKRVLLSPSHESTPSSTEKATTIASTPSPKLLPSTVASPPDFQAAITNAVETLLPGVLQTMLPDMLSRLFAVSPSSSFSSPPLAPHPNGLSSTRNLLSARLNAIAKTQLQILQDEALARVAIADAEFEDVLEDHRLDLVMAKDEGITELNRAFDDRLEEFKETTTEIAAEVAEEVGDKVGLHAEEVCADVCERVDALVGMEPAWGRREKEINARRRRVEERVRGHEVGWRGGREGQRHFLCE